MESSSTLRLDLPIAGMTCVACAARVEKALNKLDGVRAEVNFATATVRARYIPGLATVAELAGAIRKAEYRASERVEATHAKAKNVHPSRSAISVR